MSPEAVILRENPNPLEVEWIFNGVTQVPSPYDTEKDAHFGLHISFTPEKIILSLNEFPKNRILQTDDQHLFLLASFGSLRFPDVAPKVNIDYIARCLTSGVTLNGKKYFFYGHSNSQLRSHSCFLRQGRSEADIHSRILSLGDFKSIDSPAKLAKRIGLLFSAAEQDSVLDPSHTRDVPDLMVGDTLFSDGCGLISQAYARLLAKKKQAIFRQVKYVPSVFQIRYKGYKGVLMLHPPLDSQNDGYVHFRKSMRKFTGVPNDTLSIIKYSVPYTYGRLNNEIVALLSSLGISDEVLLGKLRAYMSWLRTVCTNLSSALDFVSSIDKHSLVERILLEGIDSAGIQRELKKALKQEIEKFKKVDIEKKKLRVLVNNSRRLFGVCDPFQILREGEVFVRVTMPHAGPRTIHSCSVLIFRNPCMHPGDCLKLRAVDKPELRHLVDCVVFASKGRHAAPSLSSGGDLDGDEYTIIWDKDLIPSRVFEHYLYPPVKEKKKSVITRRDLAAHFANYNSISMGTTARLYWQWVRFHPEGAKSQECQDLNALYSQCVDGGSIKIPERLRGVPEGPTRFIVDQMWAEGMAFAEEWLKKEENAEAYVEQGTDEETIIALLGSPRVSLTEFQTIQLAQRLARRSSLSLRPYYSMMDFSSLRDSEKRIIADTFEMNAEERASLWISLMRSNILPQSAFQRDLREPPLRLQRLYSTRDVCPSGFFEYLKRSMDHFKRRLLIIKTDDRFSAGIFIRGPVSWNEDQLVNKEIAVFALTPTGGQSMSLYKSTVDGYRLRCSHGLFQLFNKNIGNTWIFINRAPADAAYELQVSIALDKISSRAQKHVGRINRTPVVDVEIHVVSNQDRLAQQIFDLRVDSVVTEERLKSVADPAPYTRKSLSNVEWSQLPDLWKTVFTADEEKAKAVLTASGVDELNALMEFSLRHHAEMRSFTIFRALQGNASVGIDDIARWLLRYPQLVFVVLHAQLTGGTDTLPRPFDGIRQVILDAVLLFANEGHQACQFAIEKLQQDISAIDFGQYSNTLWATSMVVRHSDLVQDLLVLLDNQRAGRNATELNQYTHTQALQIVSERAYEAAELCICNGQGYPIQKQQTTPVRVSIHPKSSNLAASAKEGGEGADILAASSTTPVVVAEIRVDKPSSARLYSHVRLQPASKPENQPASWKEEILDGIVKGSGQYQLEIELFHHPPPEYAEMEWTMYDCGSTANARAKLDAVERLQMGASEAPIFHRIITGDASGSDAPPVNCAQGMPETNWDGFNTSQKQAVQDSYKSHISLIWGPPGTGKTTVAVKILELLVRTLEDSERILMTASTHNAVDNVLERFARANDSKGWIADDMIVRAATDYEKVNESVKKYTIEAILGGNPTEDPKLIKKAEQRIKKAKLVFSTCAGAGLGALRKIHFRDVIIDEASQITEADALVPLVKGSTRAILIGDHIQLRPIVQNMPEKLRAAIKRRIDILVSGGYSGDRLESLLCLLEKKWDMSLFERLYTGPNLHGLSRSMLDIQYRFPEHLARFPSQQFYQGKLKTGTDIRNLDEKLASTSFPWPRSKTGKIIPEAFVSCSEPEYCDRRSFMNAGQAKVIATIVRLLRSPSAHSAPQEPTSIVVLTPYRGQLDKLKENVPPDVKVNTIDGFQGKEADIVIFSTVRCNTSRVIGFLADERRLNVAWTRARLGRIIVGDSDTLQGGREKLSEDTSQPVVNGLWKAALQHCPRVTIPK